MGPFVFGFCQFSEDRCFTSFQIIFLLCKTGTVPHICLYLLKGVHFRYLRVTSSSLFLTKINKILQYGGLS